MCCPNQNCFRPVVAHFLTLKFIMIILSSDIGFARINSDSKSQRYLLHMRSTLTFLNSNSYAFPIQRTTCHDLMPKEHTIDKCDAALKQGFGIQITSIQITFYQQPITTYFKRRSGKIVYIVPIDFILNRAVF